MLLPSPTCLWLQQLLSLPSAVLSVCLSFWPVFRSLPVCWSAFILAFFSYSSCQLILKPYFLPVFSPLYFPFLSYLCHSLFTTNFISLFPLVLLSYLSHSSAPPLQFSFLSPPSLPPSSSLWHLVLRCRWGTVDCSTVCCRAVPGALGGSVCLCASGNVFLNQQLQSRTCTAASDLGIHAHTVHTFQNRCWSKIALKEQRGDGVVLL